MKCPYCGHSDDRVLDTRVHKEGEQIRRRRECLQCKSRFSTQEVVCVDLPPVIKKDGRREPFDREKILKGLQAACQKRPVSIAQMEALVERVAKWVMGRTEREIPARSIGQRVMTELKALDDVAYIRFASVYKTFKDVNEFVVSLKNNVDDQQSFDLTNSSN